MTSLIDYLEYWWFSFSSYNLIIKVAIAVIFTSCVATMLLMLRIFVVRGNKKRTKTLIQGQRPKVFSFLRNILISNDRFTADDVHTLYLQGFGKLTKKSYVSLLPTLEDIVKQERKTLNSNNYNSLIKGLKIDKCLEERLDYSSTRMRMLALQSLSRLGLTISDSKILPYAYSNDEALRKESRISYMGVSNNNPFMFMDDSDSINEWEEINLMHQFEVHHKEHLPNFSKWIEYSDDVEKIKFFIRQAAFFNQQTAVSTIVKFLLHDDYRVRKEAILAVGKMQSQDSEQTLIDIYFAQPLMCQFAIIESISFLNSGKSLDFLKKAYDLAENPDLKRLCAEAIYFYGSEGRLLFNELIKSESLYNKTILEHVQNSLIISTLKTFHGFAKSYNRAAVTA